MAGPIFSGPRSGRVVFLDRDGVINEDSPTHVRSVADWRALPGSMEAIARLSGAGIRVVVVTNQSGVGRGLFGIEDLRDIHRRLHAEVRRAGGRIAGTFFCPHPPAWGCRCRKPMPGLLERAAATLGLSTRGAPMIGDRRSDLLAGVRAGCIPVLVRTGHGGSVRLDGMPDPPAVHRDLLEAVESLLGE